MNSPRRIARAGSSAFAALVLTLTQVAHAQQQSPPAPDDAAREVVDIDREIAVQRRAREALAADIEEFDSSLDGVPPASQRAGSRPATTTTVAPSPDPLRQARDTVDVDAEIAKARQIRARLSEELQRLVHGLAGADARLASVNELGPRVAALSSRVETLQQRLEESREAESRTAQARDALAVELEKLKSERGLQQAMLDTVQRRLEELSTETSGTREVTGSALASLETVYSERVNALEQRLSEARATEHDLREQLKEAGTQREELRAQAAVAPLMAADRVEAARMATQVESLSRALASLRTESTDARVELETAYESRVEELERQLTDLASKETAAREGLLQAHAQTEQVRESLSGKLGELLASLDELAGALSREREAHADTRTRLAALHAERAEQADPPDTAGALRDELTELRREAVTLRGAQEQRIIALHTERDALQEQATDLRAQLADSVARGESLDANVAALGRTLDATRAERDGLREQRESLQREAAQLRTEIATAAAREKELVEDVKALEQAFSEAQVDLEALRDERQALREEVAEQRAQGQVSGTREEFLNARVTSLETDNDALREQLAALELQAERELGQVEEERSANRSERAALSEQLTQLQAEAGRELDAARAELAALRRTNATLREQIGALQGETREQQARTEAERAELVGELDALRSTQARFEEQLASLVGERDALREQLASSNARARQDLRGARAELAALREENAALLGKLATLEAELEQLSSRVPEPEPEPAPRTHVVQRGESLSTIARQYLGDAGRWRLIYDANQDQISNPDVVEPGTALVIPTP